MFSEEFDERILYKTKYSTATFFFPIIFILFGLCIERIGLIIVIPSAIWLIIEIKNYVSCEFTITNKRIIAKYGFFSRNILEIDINKVDEIDVGQGIIGHILDYGSITIKAAGIKNIWPRGVDNPNDFEKAFYRVINKEWENAFR